MRPSRSGGRPAARRRARPAPVGIVERLALVAAGAVVTRVVLRAVGPGVSQPNYRGREVSLSGGPALGVGASLIAAAGPFPAAALVAGLGAAVAGRCDDLLGHRDVMVTLHPSSPAGRRPIPGGPGAFPGGPGAFPGSPTPVLAKGLGGHLRAVRQGQVTAGVIKAVGLGAASLVAGALLPAGRSGRIRDAILAGGVIAGTAHLVNLLDLRPGRALKVSLALAVALSATGRFDLVAGPLGAAAAMLGDDLGERVMLGDAGASSLGALLGVALAARSSPRARLGLVVALGAVAVTSERISLSAVIDATPTLRRLDQLGRAPGPGQLRASPPLAVLPPMPPPPMLTPSSDVGRAAPSTSTAQPFGPASTGFGPGNGDGVELCSAVRRERHRARTNRKF